MNDQLDLEQQATELLRQAGYDEGGQVLLFNENNKPKKDRQKEFENSFKQKSQKFWYTT